MYASTDTEAGGTVTEEKDDNPHEQALHNFSTQYGSAMSGFDQLNLDVSGRLSDFAAMARQYGVEDYSAQIFGNAKILTLLEQINKNLEDADESDAEHVAKLVADMLLFASLIPTHMTEYKRKFGKSGFTRLTVNVLSPARLIDILVEIAQQTAAGGDVSDSATLKDIGFDDQDSVAQRMLKLSLANMQKTARAHLQNNDLFKALLASPDILRVMLASGGAVEQRFLNTCAAAAVNQEVQTNVTNIAGLLMVGRGVTGYIESQLGNSNLEESLNKTHKRTRKLKKVTIRQHALKRITEARTAFNEIEQEATEIVLKKPVDIQALQRLTQRWSRIMQKLSGVVNLEDGTKGVQVLSKNRIREHWKASAIVSTLSGAPFDRPLRRAEGIDESHFREAVAEMLAVSTSGRSEATENLNTHLGKKRSDRTQGLQGSLGQSI